ncbi:hypothetical protein B0I37DRAFT_417800 [Chaetomium sp. MPI-CAGE-AT-0009]|nr:hypothetical protein B0I37DRAFT_417800 [Chaetomium sp. MPI-CAGE-AT-0009]
MAQLTASSTLTSAPSILGRLTVEPPIAEDEGPVVNPMSLRALYPGEMINAGVGAVTGAIAGQKSADMVPGLISSIAGIVQAAQSGTVIPRDQLVWLAVNSPGFYCVVGAVANGMLPAPPPPHVIAALAQRVQRDFPSMWYVNFPYARSGHYVEEIRRNRQSMANFRSWSSKRWWEEVSRRFGIADEAIERARQSKQFLEIACEDMVKMSWLRTTRPPHTINHGFECDRDQLHRMLVDEIMNDWSTVDDNLMNAIEPIFRDIIKAAVAGEREVSQMKNVVIEKYEYTRSTGCVTSYIRLLSFEVKEGVYDIIRGKGERRARVRVELSMCLYEAIFEAALWEQFSATLHEDETDLLWDYIQGQTIDVRG